MPDDDEPDALGDFTLEEQKAAVTLLELCTSLAEARAEIERLKVEREVLRKRLASIGEHIDFILKKMQP